MAQYPTYTASDVALFSGGQEADYGDYLEQALTQATLLFKIGTCLAQFPDNEMDAEIAKLGILSMADAIYGSQPFQATLRNPFSSETIGSYSYSKMSSAVSAGLPTGVSWFDLATTRLSVCDQQLGLPASGGWNVMEENKSPHDGYGVYLGPGDQNPDGWGPDTYGGES